MMHVKIKINWGNITLRRANLEREGPFEKAIFCPGLKVKALGNLLKSSQTYYSYTEEKIIIPTLLDY